MWQQENKSLAVFLLLCSTSLGLALLVLSFLLFQEAKISLESALWVLFLSMLGFTPLLSLCFWLLLSFYLRRRSICSLLILLGLPICVGASLFGIGFSKGVDFDQNFVLALSWMVGTWILVMTLLLGGNLILEKLFLRIQYPILPDLIHTTTQGSPSIPQSDEETKQEWGDGNSQNNPSHSGAANKTV